MTFGRWLQQAHDELAQAQARLPSDPALTLDDVGAAVAARERVYLRLARLVELVAGGQPARADIDRDTVDHALRMPGNHATQLYLGLTAAAGLDRRSAPTAAPISRVGRHLAAATDAVAVGGDVRQGGGVAGTGAHRDALRDQRFPSRRCVGDAKVVVHRNLNTDVREAAERLWDDLLDGVTELQGNVGVLRPDEGQEH